MRSAYELLPEAAPPKINVTCDDNFNTLFSTEAVPVGNRRARLKQAEQRQFLGSKLMTGVGRQQDGAFCAHSLTDLLPSGRIPLSQLTAHHHVGPILIVALLQDVDGVAVFGGKCMVREAHIDNPLPKKAMKAELLDAETELRLAYAWRDKRDEAALHRLINAYLRLAISMAAKFKRYGAPMNDLIQEAGLGLMKAADKFDPDRGVRFSTYAVWWIKASIQDYVMRNWSMVRTGSTSSQKSLFFNMRRVQAQLERSASTRGCKLDRHQLHQKIATEIGVPIRDVEMMEGRLSGSDFSLNAVQSADEDGREWIDALEDDSAQAQELVEKGHDRRQLRVWLVTAMQALNGRERFIVKERKLRDRPRTLESLGSELGLSKERVRQLEAAAFLKMRKNLETQSREVHSLLA